MKVNVVDCMCILFQGPEEKLNSDDIGRNPFDNSVPTETFEQSYSPLPTENILPLDSPLPPEDIPMQNSPPCFAEVYSPPNSPPPPEYFSPPQSPSIPLSPASMLDQDMPCADPEDVSSHR